MKPISRRYAEEELKRRWGIGHQYGCACGMKPSCRELRQAASFKFLDMSENKKQKEGQGRDKIENETTTIDRGEK